jgi:branched-chain amino acid transport system ATP-binding protein
MSLLRLEKVSVRYGDMEALSEVTIEIKEGAITSLVGANGAGKSTILNAISGLIPCSNGSIYFDNERIEHFPTHKRVELGLMQIPEGRHIFPYMNTRENLEMGSMSKISKQKRKENLEKVMEIFPVLSERANQTASTLSGGEQQMLAIGRGLMTNPRLLMLDEPSLGLSPILVREIFEIMLRINESGMTILLVEQNVKASLQIASWGYVLENGQIVMSGEAREILDSVRVRKAYLGL